MNLTKSNISKKFILCINENELNLIGMSLEQLRDGKNWTGGGEIGKIIETNLRMSAAAMIAKMWSQQWELVRSD